jgi:hypothetical protein
MYMMIIATSARLSVFLNHSFRALLPRSLAISAIAGGWRQHLPQIALFLHGFGSSFVGSIGRDSSDHPAKIQ